MEYDNRVTVNGKPQMFISEFNIRNDLMSEKQTNLTFSKASIEEVPNHVFNLNLLRR